MRRLGALQSLRALVGDLFRSEPSPLEATVVSFFSKAGREIAREAPGHLRSVHPILLAEHDPPDPLDVRQLLERLSPGERAYFAHLGLPNEGLFRALDRCRIENHPVLALSYDVMRAAIADDRCGEVLRELEATHFRSQNLFRARSAVQDPHFFFGRASLIAEVGGALARGDAILVTGLRKVGKSSFLHILRQHLSDHPWCHIDLQSVDPQKPWAPGVFAAVLSSIDRFGAATHSDWPGRGETLSDGTAFVAALRERLRWQQQRGTVRRPVLVFDEGERVCPKAGELDVARHLVQAGALRAAADHHPPLLSILAADLRPNLNAVNLLPGGHTNPFYAFFREIPLPPFSRDEVEEMVRSIGRMMGVTEIEPSFIDGLCALGGGHPGFTREIAAVAYETERARPEALSGVDLERALRVLHRGGHIERFFRQSLWEPMTSEEQALMSWFAREADGRTEDEIPEALLVREALASLLAQGLLRETGPEPKLQIAFGGFGHWLRQRVRSPGTHPSAAFVPKV